MNEKVVSERTEVRRSGCDVNKLATLRTKQFHGQLMRRVYLKTIIMMYPIGRGMGRGLCDQT